jgi:hypothetical protein
MDVVAHRMLSRMDVVAQWICRAVDCHRAVDFVAQWLSSRSGCGCCRAVDLSRSGFCRAVDLSRSGFHRAKDSRSGLSQRMLSRRGFSCAQATGRAAQMTGLVVNFKITF